jgi:hypothetical protein
LGIGKSEGKTSPKLRKENADKIVTVGQRHIWTIDLGHRASMSQEFEGREVGPRQHDKVTWTRLKGGTFHPVDLFGVLEVERPRALAQESRSREFRNPYWVEAVVTSVVIWT